MLFRSIDISEKKFASSRETFRRADADSTEVPVGNGLEWTVKL